MYASLKKSCILVKMNKASQSLNVSNLSTEEENPTNTNAGVVVSYQFNAWLSISEYQQSR